MNITYKISATWWPRHRGGQPVEGAPSVPQILQQLAAEGVCSTLAPGDDELHRGRGHARLAGGRCGHTRDGMDALVKQLREWKGGVRHRLRADLCGREASTPQEEGARRSAEGVSSRGGLQGWRCGVLRNSSPSCRWKPRWVESARSTRARATDYSCVQGVCPSFITVEAARCANREGQRCAAHQPPTPTLASLEHPLNIVITGVGGTGVVTIGALLGMAATSRARRPRAGHGRPGAEGWRRRIARSPGGSPRGCMRRGLPHSKPTWCSGDLMVGAGKDALALWMRSALAR